MEYRLEPEAALLREILRPIINQDAFDALLAKPNWFDWDLFEEHLFRARVVPLVAATASRNGEIARLMPRALWERLVHEGEKGAVRALLKEAELRRIRELFAEAGIHSIVLKGLPFATRYFGDSSHRDIRDLDLLVPPEQLRPAERALRSAGYHLFEAVHSRRYYRRHHFHVVYVRHSQTIEVVELHWNLLHHPSNLDVDISRLFRERIEYRFQGMPLSLLAPLDELVYICASFRMSQFASLKRLVDLDRAFRGNEADLTPAEVVERGKSWGIADVVTSSFHFLQRFWGDPRYEVKTSRRIVRHASRYRGSDFLGPRSRRKMRLRVWCSAFYGRRPFPALACRLLFPDEAFQVELYYSWEGRVSLRTKLRRFLSGVHSLLDVTAHLLIAPFRTLR
jgi:hypothetical protein